MREERFFAYLPSPNVTERWCGTPTHGVPLHSEVRTWLVSEGPDQSGREDGRRRPRFRDAKWLAGGRTAGGSCQLQGWRSHGPRERRGQLL